MGLPVVIIASGGLPVTESSNGFGIPMTEGSAGFGLPVTFVSSGGLPVVGITAGEPGEAPSMQFNVASNSQLLAVLEDF